MEPNISPHLLLIEDNPGDADLIRLRLVEGSSDLEVACVNRLSLGLQSLAEKLPAVVLLDLNLPDSHGADTFRRVLKSAPTVPIVVLSGLEDELLATKAVHQGVQDYLVKGKFDFKQLERAIRYAIERQALLTSLDMSRKQQLQFKDEFLSHVSHELRTPLTTVHQFATILLDGLAGPLSEEQTEHLSTILGSANQIQTMIHDLLEATRAESGKLRVDVRCIDIGDVVQQSIAMLSETAKEKNIRLKAEVEAGIPLVAADPERVLQILLNLIDNGLKFTPSGGSVIVKAALAAKDPEYVCFSVTDTGRGVSVESKRLIFERLYQDPNSSNNSRRGLGLGLYIAQELVRLHSGRIWVESQIGHGASFYFTLPLFSLGKLLSPLITSEGKLSEPLVLLKVEFTPKHYPGLPSPASVRQQCMDILRSCVCPDKDVILPPISGPGGNEVFLLIASANEHGTNVLLKRISGQIERSPELQAVVQTTLSANPLILPKDSGLPLEALMQRVADATNSAASPALRQQISDSREAPPPTSFPTIENAEQKNEKRKQNGKTKNTYR